MVCFALYSVRSELSLSENLSSLYCGPKSVVMRKHSCSALHNPKIDTSMAI